VREARRLAQMMVDIGEDAGVRTRAVLSAMEQPLGRAIGNSLEVAEAVAILRGTGPDDVTRICQHEVVTLLSMTGIAKSHAEGEKLYQRAITSGSGLAKLAEVVKAQGGDAKQVEDPSRLPVAPVVEVVKAPRTGYIAAIDAERVGMASVRLGAGRMRKEDAIDPAVGLVLRAKVGDHLKAGQPLIEVHARTKQQAGAIRDELLASYGWSEEPVKPQRLLYGSVERR
jgi:thymidine phosphorylase